MDDRSLTVCFEEKHVEYEDSSEKPCLYGYHQGKENLHHRRYHQGIGLFHPQHGRAEAEYKVEGKAITIIQ